MVRGSGTWRRARTRAPDRRSGGLQLLESALSIPFENNLAFTEGREAPSDRGCYIEQSYAGAEGVHGLAAIGGARARRSSDT